MSLIREGSLSFNEREFLRHLLTYGDVEDTRLEPCELKLRKAEMGVALHKRNGRCLRYNLVASGSPNLRTTLRW